MQHHFQVVLLCLVTALAITIAYENQSYYNYIPTTRHVVRDVYYINYGTSAISSNRRLKDVEKRVPFFITRSGLFRGVMGSNLILPCMVNASAKTVLAWKRGMAILTAGLTKVRPSTRIALLSENLTSLDGGVSYPLELRDIDPSDAGDYQCQTGSLMPMEISHIVEVLVPARIAVFSHDDYFDVMNNSEVKVQCRGEGNPIPKVLWTLNDHRLPDKAIVSGNYLVVRNVTRHDAGVYRCVVDNGLGVKPNRSVYINVSYPPVVTVAEDVVVTGLGLKVELRCIVYGGPTPVVNWFKGNIEIINPRYIINSNGAIHTLTIYRVQRMDFDTFSCGAINKFGRSDGYITLTPLASRAIIDSPKTSDYADRYNLTWSVRTIYEISEYRLVFRELLPPALTYGVPTTPLTKLFPPSAVSPDESDYPPQSWRTGHTGHMWVVLLISGSEETDTEAPIKGDLISTQHMSYLVHDLLPNTSYEAHVQARNAFGWNQLSKDFTFSTRDYAIHDVNFGFDEQFTPPVRAGEMRSFAFENIPPILIFLEIGMYLMYTNM